MGTHPIFESDFDCLTEFAVILRIPRRLMKLIVGKDDNPVILLSSVFAKQLKTVESGKDSKPILNSGSEVIHVPTMARFLARADKKTALPATTTVINYDCPNSVTDYVHRVGRCGRMNRRGHAMTLITQGDKDRIRILRGVMLQSGAVLPKSVLDLAKPDLNDKKRVKKQKVEREELETKVPKRELKATETKRKRKLMAEKKRRDKLKKAKILNVSDNTEWEVAE